MSARLLDRKLSTETQGRTLRSYHDINGVKIEVVVYSDSYPNQSSAVVKALDPTTLKFNPVARVDYPQMASATTEKRGKYATDETLGADEAELLRLAVLVLA